MQCWCEPLTCFSAAQIPNPLFDLAGLMCGHFGISFWTFFGATALGKAVMKVGVAAPRDQQPASRRAMRADRCWQVTVQELFVVLVFADLENAVDIFEHVVPFSSAHLRTLLEDYKKRFHPHTAAAGGAAAASARGASWLELAWQVFLVSTVAWFLKSIVESLVEQRLTELEAAKAEEAENAGPGSPTVVVTDDWHVDPAVREM
jgi:hypothetical protein